MAKKATKTKKQPGWYAITYRGRPHTARLYDDGLVHVWIETGRTGANGYRQKGWKRLKSLPRGAKFLPDCKGPPR